MVQLIFKEKKIYFIYLYSIIISINSKNIYKVHLKCLLNNNNNSKNNLNIFYFYVILLNQVIFNLFNASLRIVFIL